MRFGFTLIAIVLMSACRDDKDHASDSEVPIDTDLTPDTDDTDAPTGGTDTDTDVTDCPEWYPDNDGDGFGDIDAAPVVDCTPPANHSDNALDCNDADPQVHPDAAEVCDEADVDEDCNGLADDADPAATGHVDAWPDADADGFGDSAAAPSLYCDAPAGWAVLPDDCDDANGFAFPGAAFAEDLVSCMVDEDGDGWGSMTPTGTAVAGSDCDDADPLLSPDTPELFGDDLDQDCDGEDLWFLFDDFELGAQDPSVFASISGETTFTSTDVYAGSWAADLSAFGSMLTGVTLDTSACTGLRWSFMGKRGPEQPDSGEDLHVQYFDGTHWVTVHTWLGEGINDPGFSLRTGMITEPAAMHPTFALRLSAANGSSTGLDNYFVDDFVLECAGVDADSDGVPERYDCDDTDAAHWSDCGVCVDVDGDHYGLGCDFGDDCDDSDPAAFPGAPDPIGSGDQNCDGTDGPIYFDDFSVGVLAASKWATATGDISVTQEFAVSDSWSLNVRGDVGEAITTPLDTSSCNEVRWQFQAKRGPEAPDAGEFLELSYPDGAGGWVVVESIEGDGSNDAGFTFYTGVITNPAALSSALTMRFSWDGVSASDDFFIDDFGFGCPLDADGDGTLGDCDDSDPRHWSDCATCVDADNDGFGLDCDLGPDCDDAHASAAPGLPDLPDDGVDGDCSGVDGAGLFDDFDLGAPYPGLWAELGTAVVTNAHSSSGTSSLHLESSTSATTQPFDMSSCGAMVWSYMGKRGPDAPEANEDLHLEVWTGAEWARIDTWVGSGSEDPTFVARSGPILLPEAFHSAFQLRLVAEGTATTDDWFIDDLAVECDVDSDGDHVGDNTDCAPNDADHWADCGLCVDADGDRFGLDCDLGPDCDDGDLTVFPGAFDTWGDGVDQDCDLLDSAGVADDFETGAPRASAWAVVSGSAEMTTTWVGEGTASFSLYGSDGYLESTSFDTSTCSGIVWSYLGKRGDPEMPDSGDTLDLEYWDGTSWVLLDSWEGGATDATFSQRFGEVIAPGVLHPDFKVRFTSHGTSSSDYFHIDDVLVVCAGADNDGDGVSVALDCDDGDRAHWSDCGLCLDADDDNYGPFCDLGDDCDDSDSAIFPGAVDIPGDGIDQDCTYFDGGDGLFDSFESGTLRAAIWAASGGDVSIASDQSSFGNYSLLLDGDGYADTVDVDTSTCGEVLWFYDGQRGPDGPESSDELAVSWWDGAAWVVTDIWPGGVTDDGFQQRFGILTDPAAFSPTFRLRLESDSSLAGSDAFYVDEVGVGCSGGDADGDGIPLPLDCDDASADHWADCALCVDDDADGYGADCDLGKDCDDADGSSYPGGSDALGDGVDQDCSRADGPGIYDDFEDGFSALNWALQTDVTYEVDASKSGVTSLVLGPSGVAETTPRDLSACSAVFWSYQVTHDAADAGETLTLSWDNAGSWVAVDVLEGDASDMAPFQHHWGVINHPAARAPGFRMQLLADSTIEDWYVDDFTLGCHLGDGDGDGVPANLDCDDGDPLHWSDCGLCVDADGDGYGLDCDLGGDCDDGSAAFNPGAPDVDGDGIDHDCGGSDGLGVFDDFEAGFDGNKWSFQTDATYETTAAWSGVTSLVLGPSGVAETTPRDPSTCSSVFWAYQVTHDAADAGETLTLSWYDGSAWVPADVFEGDVSDMAPFQHRWGVISDPAALVPGFQMQLLADSTIEDWFIDDFLFGCNLGDADGDGVPANIDCDDADAWHWSDCGLCVDADNDGFGLDCDLGADCDDGSAAINPDASDVLGDGIDHDCGGTDGPGFFDDFEAGLDTSIWAYQFNVTYVTDLAWSGTTSLEIGSSGVAETVGRDMSTCSAVFWGYYGRREGAEDDESLTLSYDDGFAWVPVDTWFGDSVTDPDLSLRWGIITDPLAFQPGFRIQFLGDASLTSETWLVDDLMVECDLGDADFDAIPANVDCDDGDPLHWFDCGLCVDADLDGFGLDCDLGPDCDDANPAANPVGAADLVLDGVDNDCDTLELLIAQDDFDAGFSTLFTSLTGDLAVVEPSGITCPAAACDDVLHMSGVSTATTAQFDTTACATVGWTYQGRRGPVNAPEVSDELTLEWNSGAGWVAADVWTGGSDLEFGVRSGTITDPAALSATLAVRLVSDGSAGIDDWYVDDFRVGCAD